MEVSNNITPERHLEPWLSPEEHNKLKEEFLQVNKEQFLTAINTSGAFSDLPDHLRLKGAELTTQFMFGIYSVFRRYGFKYNEYNLLYNTKEDSKEPDIGYIFNEKRFTIKVSFLKNLLKTPNLTSMGAWITKPMKPETLFEVAGVEEAAHYLYDHEKGMKSEDDYSKKFHLVNDPRYYHSEGEKRAFLWKLAYVKRYLPEYYSSLKNSYENIYSHEG